MLIDKDDAIKAVCEACYMYKYIGEHYKECRYYPCDDIKALEAIPSAEAEQVTGKLDSPCGSSVTGDSEERKEQKSKLESADATCATCADRALCIMSAPDGKWKACKDYRAEAEEYEDYEHATLVDIKEPLKASAEAVQGWIPCSERLPEKDELVLVTVWNDVSIAWRNIYGGWESAEDMYEKGDVYAWMPLPTPYKGGDDE